MMADHFRSALQADAKRATAAAKAAPTNYKVVSQRPAILSAAAYSLTSQKPSEPTVSMRARSVASGLPADQAFWPEMDRMMADHFRSALQADAKRATAAAKAASQKPSEPTVSMRARSVASGLPAAIASSKRPSARRARHWTW
jgi:hypothetical protein